MRGKFSVIRPHFGGILSKIDVKIQNRALPKFRNLVLDSRIKNRSSFN
jgi:hypothetical protein